MRHFAICWKLDATLISEVSTRGTHESESWWILLSEHLILRKRIIDGLHLNVSSLMSVLKEQSSLLLWLRLAMCWAFVMMTCEIPLDSLTDVCQISQITDERNMITSSGASNWSLFIRASFMIFKTFKSREGSWHSRFWKYRTSEWSVIKTRWHESCIFNRSAIERKSSQKLCIDMIRRWRTVLDSVVSQDFCDDGNSFNFNACRGITSVRKYPKYGIDPRTWKSVHPSSIIQIKKSLVSSSRWRRRVWRKISNL